MSIRKLTDDLNIISSLPNRPTETSDELKEKFDEAANLIKKYLNDILVSDTEKEIETKVSDATTMINKTMSDLQTNVEDSISTLESNIEQTISDLKEELNDNISKTLNYSGFEVTNHNVNYSLGGGTSTASGQTVTKEGYYPLGIVGEANTNNACDVRKCYLSTRNSGSAVCSYLIHNEDYGNSRSGTFTYYILWVKVS